MLDKRSPKPASAALQGLRAAALSAITTYGDESRTPFEDDNPYTAELSPYDLARLFCPTRGSRENPVADLDDVATIIRRTTGADASRRAAARAHWVAHELKRLGHHREAKGFVTLAEEKTH